MTYSYLLTVPLIASYAIGFAIIKYYEGFISHPILGIIPKPYQLWGPSASSAIFPLMLMFSIGWGLEMVTHLEGEGHHSHIVGKRLTKICFDAELCFWLFLVNSGSAQQDWFHSMYFKTWVVGSSIAVVYMPLVTIFTRSDPLKMDLPKLSPKPRSYILLLFQVTELTFDHKCRQRSEGVDINTIVRLTKFSELNMIRVVFRFMFTVPLLILGVDGVRPHHHINESMLWTDFLAMIAGFGCAISSGITLIIFFPRSVEGEIAARDASRERKRTRSHANAASMHESYPHSNMTQSMHSVNYANGTAGTYLLTSSPPKQHLPLDRESHDGHFDDATMIQRPLSIAKSIDKHWVDEERDVLPSLPPIRPNRRKGHDIELGGIARTSLTEANLSKHNLRASNVNHMVHNFTSPIGMTSSFSSCEVLTQGSSDFVYGSGQEPDNRSWLTFNRR
ncbi:hypothetical protein H0H81_010456 [Sphagnurus paluster]|uniref:Uncharacterized protein n=1 Tax=Sphagnurus paluster TaxID=117069 RepID=A0A9P7KIF6_9AGAR|nr:hypothetical protein H0H81_010456 [Sphagnurus paluster]